MGSRRKGIGVVEIARELGVSTATVSRALNRSQAVRPELAERIRDFATAQGYVPNRLARALSANRDQGFVAFVIPYIDTPAYTAVAAECARKLSDLGTQLILAITENDPQRELRELRGLLGSQSAGVIIAPSTRMLPASKQLLNGVALVEFHRSAGLNAPGVFMDDERALSDAVVYLAELGHTKIGYVGTNEELSNGVWRLRGVRDGVRKAGLEESQVMISLVSPDPSVQRASFEATAAMLRSRRRPTAIIGGGGTASLGVAQAVRESGLTLPDELSVIVYGDPRWFALHNPPLTAISAPYDELARQVVDLLAQELKPHDAVDHGRVGEVSNTRAVTRRVVATSLQVNGSTGAPPPR